VDEFIAAEYVMYPIASGLQPGPEGTKQAITTYRTAFPDLQVTVEDIFAAGDRVAFRWNFRGTHLGDWLGVPPTGNHMAATGISVYRMVGGKVVENWTNIDLSPTEEEQRWLMEGGGWPRKSPDIPATERDTSQSLIWDVLTRNLTWRFRVAEAQERERIEQELQVSRRIQQASLPEEVPKLEGWQISPLYQPAREVGGDFYDFHLLSEGRLGVVVGDATGKGVPAALVMSTTLGMLRLAAQSYSSPGQMLRRVNEALCPYIPPNTFVTCFYAVLDPESGLLRYANAGHDLPYLHHDGEAKELRARGMPLGLMSSMGYEEMELVLKAGESVLFYSDGLVEAHDPKGEMFGFPRLRALVAEHAEERSLGEYLLEELYSFVGEGWEQEDDITLVTLRCSAPLS
jgi:predicted ester cyclase